MHTPHTPREILLARHTGSLPALDSQKAALLARFAEAAEPRLRTDSARSLRDILTVLHRELFAPYRRAWSALACIWIALLAAQQVDRLSTPDSLASATNSATQVDPTLLALWLEQRRLLAEFSARSAEAPSSVITPATRPSSDKSRPASLPRPLGVVVPKPHSTRAETALV